MIQNITKLHSYLWYGFNMLIAILLPILIFFKFKQLIFTEYVRCREFNPLFLIIDANILKQCKIVHTVIWRVFKYARVPWEILINFRIFDADGGGHGE